ncbi:Ni/Co efflux regulator RcnB [Luteibacter sp. HA06]|jgi:Ni/Co efflux regulator RcnB
MKLMLRTAFAALALVATTAAFADDHHDHDHDRGRDNHGYDRGHDRGHDNRDWHHDNGWHGNRPPPPRYYGHGYDNGPSYYHRPPPPRYYGHWERGHRYYGGNTVVYDYGSYRLRPPPRGYHWVRENNDFLLVAVATGIIFDIATR